MPVARVQIPYGVQLYATLFEPSIMVGGFVCFGGVYVAWGRVVGVGLVSC